MLQGLSVGVRGVDVYCYKYATDSIVVYEGLSLDAAWGIINGDRAVKPVVCQHWPLDTPKVGCTRLDLSGCKYHLHTWCTGDASLGLCVVYERPCWQPCVRFATLSLQCGRVHTLVC